MRIQPVVLTAALSFGACQGGGKSTIDYSPPTICSYVKGSQALVKATISQMGPDENLSQTGLAPEEVGPLFEFDDSSLDPVVALTLSVSATVFGSPQASTSLGVIANTAGDYFQLTGPDGYWFLGQDSGQWVLADTGFFLEDDAGMFRNTAAYSSGISEQDFLSQVATAQTGPCPSSVVPICALQGNCDGGTSLPDGGASDAG